MIRAVQIVLHRSLVKWLSLVCKAFAASAGFAAGAAYVNFI